jgi:hypothetical protein
MDELNGIKTAHLRESRPTDDQEAVVRFYRDGLGFTVLGEFADHDGFDGVTLGHPGSAYHLEFTRKGRASGGKGIDRGQPARLLPARPRGMGTCGRPAGAPNLDADVLPVFEMVWNRRVERVQS